MLYKAKIYHVENDDYSLIYVIQDENVIITENEKKQIIDQNRNIGAELDENGLFLMTEDSQLLTLRLNYEEPNDYEKIAKENKDLSEDDIEIDEDFDFNSINPDDYEVDPKLKENYAKEIIVGGLKKYMDEYYDILKIRIIGIAQVKDLEGNDVLILNTNNRTMFKKDYYVLESSKPYCEEDEVILGLKDDPEGKYDEPDISKEELDEYVNRVIAGEDSNKVAADIDRKREEAIKMGIRPFKLPKTEEELEYEKEQMEKKKERNNGLNVRIDSDGSIQKDNKETDSFKQIDIKDLI